jgi:hypothetical protein
MDVLLVLEHRRQIGGKVEWEVGPDRQQESVLSK